ncbi:MAG TPA: hypothetical protein VK479_07540 [Micropepsaceae bacterium]|nr:hypothetical protein [Micropepsaceae bacterium]
MRIDASNLILAAQAQTQRVAAATKEAQPRFESLDFAKSSATQEGTRTATPAMASRPGAQLDIKV